jgi:transcriptional regulator with XRE-family HTH domain
MDEYNDWYGEETATFGDRLAGAREAIGMDQPELARRLGVKVKTIRAWENDASEPRANKLQMLSGILGVSLTWLLTGMGDGLDDPRTEEPPLVPTVRDLLLEIRQIRTEISGAADRLERAETTLRAALTETEKP